MSTEMSSAFVREHLNLILFFLIAISSRRWGHTKPSEELDIVRRLPVDRAP